MFGQAKAPYPSESLKKKSNINAEVGNFRARNVVARECKLIQTRTMKLEPREFFAMSLSRPPTDDQWKAFESYQSGIRFTLLRSANGCGKTSFLAALANWHLYSNEKASVVCCSKNLTHSRRNFWKELRRQTKRMGAMWDSSKMLETEWKPDDDRACIIISPLAVESAQGFHDPNTLILVDEASGVSDEIFEGLLSNMSDSTARMLCAFNPLGLGTFVYHAERDSHWNTVVFNALNHPNVKTGQEIILGAITRQSIEATLRVHSKECDPRTPNCVGIPWLGKTFEPTPAVLARILGEYSFGTADGYIDYGLLQSSFYPLASYKPSGRLFVGVDISRGVKDQTICCEFQDGYCVGFTRIDQKNLSLIAVEINKLYGDAILALDDTGCGGGVCDRLAELGHKNFFRVNFSQEAAGFLVGKKTKPLNARTEMVMMMESALRNGSLWLPAEDEQLHLEICSYRIESCYGGRYFRLEKKTKLKKRLGGSSPDKADSLGLALYAQAQHKFTNTLFFA